MTQESLKVCCGEEMRINQDGQNLLNDDTDFKGWVCLCCGKFINITEGFLSNEELENYKENYNLNED